MITGKNIICISSIDWDFVWQGHQEVMLTFAKARNRVIFIENTGVRPPGFRDLARIKKRLINRKKSKSGVRKVHENIYVYSPIALPFPYSEPARMVNRKIFISKLLKFMKELKFTDPIIWTFLPTNTSIDIIDRIKDKKLVVYYCIAEFAELVRSPRKFEIKEKELLEKIDIVFAQGTEIKKRCEKHNKNVYIFPFGVNTRIFINAKESLETPQDMKGISHPILGYIGGIHKHVDIELIRYVAAKKPEWSIVLVGPMQVNPDSFKVHSNVYLLGNKEHKALPSYIAQFDVCLIPYRLTEYTKTVYPTKLNEYLAMGKPVVATSIPEVDLFSARHKDIISVTKTREDFLREIEKALKKEKNEDIVKKRVETAQESAWPRRIEKMSAIMEENLTSRKRKESSYV